MICCNFNFAICVLCNILLKAVYIKTKLPCLFLVVFMNEFIECAAQLYPSNVSDPDDFTASSYRTPLPK